MTPTVTREEFQICKKVAAYSAQKLQVEVDDMISYLAPKILNCKNNYRDNLGNPWLKYLTVNLRLYSLNYLRDNKSKGLSTNRAILLKAAKYADYKAASRRLGIPEATLKDMKKQQQNSEQRFASEGEPSVKEEYNPYVEMVKDLGLEKIAITPVAELKEIFKTYL